MVNLFCSRRNNTRDQGIFSFGDCPLVVISGIGYELWVKRILGLAHDQVNTGVYLCKELMTGNKCFFPGTNRQCIIEIYGVAVTNRTKKSRKAQSSRSLFLTQMTTQEGCSFLVGNSIWWYKHQNSFYLMAGSAIP